MSDQLVLAVDGGNSKTYLALAACRRPRARARPRPAELAAPSRPRGLPGRPRAPPRGRFAAAGLPRATAARRRSACSCSPASTIPAEEARCERARGAAAGPARTIVGNDTFAVLRAGTDGGWGVAVVCGAGINCVGVAPDGRQARFPALGAITGDWGGGYDVGLAAVRPPRGARTGVGRRTTPRAAPCPRISACRRPRSWPRRSTGGASRSGR